MQTLTLPPVADYFPIRNGRYDVAPGLVRLETADFANGDRDRRVFQFDREFARFHKNKADCARTAPQRHILYDSLDARTAAAAVSSIADLLLTEHPDKFELLQSDNAAPRLNCRLTGDQFALGPARKSADGPSEYRAVLECLLSQVQEDLAIVRRDPARGDWIAGLHVCSPSSWAPESKIGRSFDATHEPVPGMERIRRAAGGMVSAMISGAPTVRFTFGIAFDDRLNHHPFHLAPTPELSAFDPGNALAPVFLRVERQVTFGLPLADAALFVIRPYIYRGCKIRANPSRRADLVSALRSLSAESRAYKSLEGCFDALLAWWEGD